MDAHHDHPRASSQPSPRFKPTGDTRPGRPEGVREYPLGDEVLLYAYGRDVVHTLNASAWAIWDLCDGTRTVAEIAHELAALVAREPGDLLPDVLRTVEQLSDLGLLDSA